MVTIIRYLRFLRVLFDSGYVISIEFDLSCYMRCECEVETKFHNLIGPWLHGKTQNPYAKLNMVWL